MSTPTLTRQRGLAAAGWIGPVAGRLGSGTAVLGAAATVARASPPVCP
ncbi:hypothetical protein [Streptosporangium sp. NPDC000396]